MNYVNIEIAAGLATVKLNRPEARNALCIQMMEELRDTARKLQTNTDVHAVILCADGPFSAGADLAENAFAGGETPPTKLELREFLKLGPDMCKAWEDVEAYTVAAIEGYCVGGASALASALDYRVCGESAFFRLPEIPLGINMSWNTIPRLVAQIGPARTKEYVIFGKRVSAQDALAWGLCEQVVADGDSLSAAQGLAEEVLALPPIAVRMTKQSVNATAYALANATSFMDRDQYMLAVQTQDFAESVSAFMEKRKPRFKGD